MAVKKPQATFTAKLCPGPCKGPNYSIQCEAGASSFAFQAPSIKVLSANAMLVYLSKATQQKLLKMKYDPAALEQAIKAEFRGVFSTYRRVVFILDLSEKAIPAEFCHLREDMLDRFVEQDCKERSTRTYIQTGGRYQLVTA